MMDYASMTDIQIKQAKTRLYWLRQEATPQQDREIAAEMRRAQEVINVRQRARTLEAQRIAAETPGAVSAFITGSPAEGGAFAPASGG